MAKSNNVAVAVAATLPVAAAELPAVTAVALSETRLTLIRSYVALATDTDDKVRTIENEAAAATGKARTHALVGMVELLKGHASINFASFDEHYRKPMFDYYKASGKYAKDGTIRNRMQYDKAAFIAITNGIMPKDGEALQPFALRIGKDLKTTNGPDGQPLFKAATGTGGGRTATVATVTTAEAGKAVEMTRTMALNILCKGNEADMQVLDFMTAGHMQTIRAMYVALNPIKIK